MDHLLQNQKKDSCKLNMPEGLKELMSDISREVLRAQPADIYEFIAEYLSALMVTRDNLSIASQVCNHLCDCVCYPDLVTELQNIGLNELNAKKAQNVIRDHINRGKVNEGNLMTALAAKTDIKANMCPAIINAVRKAYLRHQAHFAKEYERGGERFSSEKEMDDIARAASHTLKLYQETGPTEEMYGEMATKIQASYRAYGVRRSVPSNKQYIYREEPIIPIDVGHVEETSVRSDSRRSSWSEELQKEYELSSNMHERRINTASSISLAGSHYGLPKYTPYNVHDVECLSLLEETDSETHYKTSKSTSNYEGKQEKTRKISFQNDLEEEIYYVARRNKHKSGEVLDIDVELIEEIISEDDEEILKVENQLYDKQSQGSEKSISEKSNDYDKADDDFDRTVVKKVDINYINLMSKETDSDSNDDADI